MKAENISNIIGINESIFIEWKSSLSQSDEIVEAIAAFSNTEGGKVFIGVSASGKLLGIQIGKDTIEKLTNHISQHTDPRVHPRIIIKKAYGKEIIIIDVRKSADRLTLAFGKPFLRVGKSTMKMSKDEYEYLILAKHKDKLQFDTQACPRARFKDIDPGRVRWFLERAKEARGFDIPAKMSIREALDRLELIKGGKLTNAALLLFGRKPQKFFVQTTVRCGRIKCTSGYDFIDMKVFEGTIPELRLSAIKFVTEYIKHAVYFDSNQRYDRWEYPLRALEEVVTNALVHRDYLSNGDIQLTIYDDRIEVWNPGELPKPLTPEDLKRKHKSIPRNELLARQLFLIKHIERWGMGTNRVVEEMRQNNLPDPEFKNLSGGFDVILSGPGKAFENEIEKEKLHKLDTNERQKKAIEYLKAKGHITRSTYCNMNNVGITYAKKELNYLIQNKVIRRAGKGKKTYYLLVTE